MSDSALMRDELRNRILSEPDVVLEDPDVMRALVVANERSLGSNVIDLRGIAMERLEARLDRLEETHRSVIAAAYENLAGMNQVHRACLAMLEAVEFDTFLKILTGKAAEILRVDCATLVLESRDGTAPALRPLEPEVVVECPGFINTYITLGRNVPVRPVTLRQLGDGEGWLFGENGDWIRSEACLVLDFGPGRLPGMLALGAEDPHQFSPAQGTDLLAFYGGAVERAMRRWLA